MKISGVAFVIVAYKQHYNDCRRLVIVAWLQWRYFAHGQPYGFFFGHVYFFINHHFRCKQFFNTYNDFGDKIIVFRGRFATKRTGQPTNCRGISFARGKRLSGWKIRTELPVQARTNLCFRGVSAARKTLVCAGC